MGLLPAITPTGHEFDLTPLLDISGTRWLEVLSHVMHLSPTLRAFMLLCLVRSAHTGRLVEHFAARKAGIVKIVIGVSPLIVLSI